jgi:hypothetical protein
LNEPLFVRAERADDAKSRIGLNVGEEPSHNAHRFAVARRAT